MDAVVLKEGPKAADEYFKVRNTRIRTLLYPSYFRQLCHPSDLLYSIFHAYVSILSVQHQLRCTLYHERIIPLFT